MMVSDKQNEAYMATIIDGIVDKYVKMVNDLAQKDVELIQATEEIADILVGLVEAFQQDRQRVPVLFSALTNHFRVLKMLIYRNLEFIIVLYGENEYLSGLIKHLNNGKNSIILLADEKFRYRDFSNFEIMPIDRIKEISYDYLICCSGNPNFKYIAKESLTKTINLDQVLDNYLTLYKTFFSKNYLYNLLNSNIEKAKCDSSYELFITGLSYSLMGLDESLLHKKSVKLTTVSQDLYYDFLIAQDLFKVSHNFKYCILGLAYYSFDFDLSLSSESWRIRDIFNPLFSDPHNYHLPNNYEPPIGIDKISDSIFANLPIFNHALMMDCLKNAPLMEQLTLLDDNHWNNLCGDVPIAQLGPQRAIGHSQLNYEKTRNEYVMIFKSYLDLLKDNGVTPIIVVFPTTRCYYDNFDETLRNRFYKIINQFHDHYNFQFYDFFNSNQFDMNDFSDSDHLNKQGAKKMTRILNDVICWED